MNTSSIESTPLPIVPPPSGQPSQDPKTASTPKPVDIAKTTVFQQTWGALLPAFCRGGTLSESFHNLVQVVLDSIDSHPILIPRALRNLLSKWDHKLPECFSQHALRVRGQTATSKWPSIDSANPADLLRFSREYEILLGQHINPFKPNDDIFKSHVGTNLKDQINKGMFKDPNTGLTVRISVEKTDDQAGKKGILHLSFQGTGTVEDSLSANLATDVAMLGMGNHVPPSLRQADKLVAAFKQIAEQTGCDLHLEGFSLGGSVATYAALRNEVKATTFNSVPLSYAAQRHIGAKKLDRAKDLITHLGVEGDPISPTGKWVEEGPTAPLTHFGRFSSGSTRSRYVGKCYRLPPAKSLDIGLKKHSGMRPSLEEYLQNKALDNFDCWSNKFLENFGLDNLKALKQVIAQPTNSVPKDSLTKAIRLIVSGEKPDESDIDNLILLCANGLSNPGDARKLLFDRVAKKSTAPEMKKIQEWLQSDSKRFALLNIQNLTNASRSQTVDPVNHLDPLLTTDFAKAHANEILKKAPADNQVLYKLKLIVSDSPYYQATQDDVKNLLKMAIALDNGLPKEDFNMKLSELKLTLTPKDFYNDWGNLQTPITSHKFLEKLDGLLNTMDEMSAEEVSKIDLVGLHQICTDKTLDNESAVNKLDEWIKKPETGIVISKIEE